MPIAPPAPTVLKPAAKIGNTFLNPVETSIGGLSLMLKILPLYLSNKEERVPRQPLGPFVTDARAYAQASATGLRITWLGHSSMLIEVDGVRVLVDPVWDERASPVSWAGPKRFFSSPLALADLPPLDAVLISHNHYDHLGKQTIRQLSGLACASRAAWVTSAGVGRDLEGFGVQKQRIAELNWTESLQVGTTGFRLTALPARHFSGRKPWDRFHSLWSSFVLKGSRHNIYFGADSGMWNGFKQIGREYGPFDISMLEIGAYHELWKSIHMGPDGAAQAFADLGGTGLLMPIHWGLFDLALHAWKQPIERLLTLADRGGIKLWMPTPGVPTDVVARQEHLSQWFA